MRLAWEEVAFWLLESRAVASVHDWNSVMEKKTSAQVHANGSWWDYHMMNDGGV